MAGSRIAFCIPLISRATASDWDRICTLLGQTLRSILAQHGEFEVLVACNEMPEVDYGGDPRVRFVVLKMDGDPPRTSPEKRLDFKNKLRVLLDDFCKSGGGYYIKIDADDLVSNRLVDYIRSDDNRVGYYFKQGYTLSLRTREFRLSNKFNQLCGSSYVMYLSGDDLKPDSPARSLLFERHAMFPENCRKIGKEVKPIPFPAAVYVTNHGESIRDNIVHATKLAKLRRRWTLTRQQLRSFFQSKTISPKNRKEFGIPDYY